MKTRIPRFKTYTRHRKWWVEYWLHGHHYRWPAGDDARAAQILISLVTLKIQEGLFDSGDKIPREAVTGEAATVEKAKRIKFRELSSLYYKRETAKLKAPEAVELQLRVLDRHFGDRYLDAIKPEDVADFLADRYSEVASGTADKSQVYLKTVLEKAVEWGYLKVNPAKNTTPANEDDDAREYFLTVPQAEKLLAACPVWLQPFVLTAFHTGGRRAELLGLRWENVMLRQKAIRFRHTKSKRDRSVPITDRVLEALKELPTYQAALQNGHVFTGPDGKPLNKQALRYAFEKARDSVGLTKEVEGPDGNMMEIRFRLHDCRHTYASWLVQSGVSLYEVKTLLGHASITMTERYSHLAPNHLKDAIKVLNTMSGARVDETDTGTDTGHESHLKGIAGAVTVSV